MKTFNVADLEKGDFIIHEDFDLCVVELVDFDSSHKVVLGVYIRPVTFDGVTNLRRYTHQVNNLFFETCKSKIIIKAEGVELPKFCFIHPNKIVLAEWDEVGIISPEGIPSHKITKIIDDPLEIFDYLMDNFEKIKFVTVRK